MADTPRDFDLAFLKWAASGFIKSAQLDSADAGEMARVLGRSLAVMHWLGGNPQGIPASQIQRDLKIPRASLYRVLSALMSQGLIAQDTKTGHFTLGTAAMSLGFLARSGSPVSRLARPILRQTALETHQLAEISAPLDPQRLITLDVWQGVETPLSVRVGPGTVAPVRHQFPPGLICLAFGSAQALDAYGEFLKREKGKAQPEFISADDDFKTDLERCRELEYAWRKHGGRPGVGRVAAPVFETRAGHSRVVAVLGIACCSTVLTPIRAAQWGPLLRRNAVLIEEALRNDPAGISKQNPPV